MQALSVDGREIPNCPLAYNVPFSTETMLQQPNLNINCGGEGIASQGSPKHSLQSMEILRASTMQEAQQLANSDPEVVAGRMLVDLHEWAFPSTESAEQ